MSYNHSSENYNSPSFINTKKEFIKSFENFMDQNINKIITSIENNNKVTKNYESFVETIFNHPIIADKISFYEKKIQDLENELNNYKKNNITLEIKEHLNNESSKFIYTDDGETMFSKEYMNKYINKTQ